MKIYLSGVLEMLPKCGVCFWVHHRLIKTCQNGTFHQLWISRQCFLVHHRSIKIYVLGVSIMTIFRMTMPMECLWIQDVRFKMIPRSWVVDHFVHPLVVTMQKQQHHRRMLLALVRPLQLRRLRRPAWQRLQL